MASKMWIGSSPTNMQWVPCPLIDSSITRKRYVDSIQFENGGGDLRGSTQYQMQYNLSFSGPAHGAEGIDVLNKFASGYYGSGYMYLAYPTHFDTNIFSAQWAYPAISGWTNSVYSNGTIVQSRYPVYAINTITAPNYETGSMTGWTGSGSGLTATVSTEQKLFGHTRSQKLVWADGSTQSRLYTGTLPVGTGTELWSFSTELYNLTTTAEIYATLRLYDATNVLLNEATNYVGGYGDNQWNGFGLDLNFSSYPTATYYTWEFFITGTGAATLYIGGQSLYDATLSGPLPFFDGASQNVGAASWEGTANASRSLLRQAISAGVTNVNINSLLIDVTKAALVVPDEKFTILIPPGKYLVLGIMGEATGTAAMYMRLNRTTTQALTLIPNGSPYGFINTVVSGESTGKFVEIYATRTSSAASTLRISSMMAQISDTFPGAFEQYTFIPGQGSTGLAFADDAVVETYSYMHPPRKAVSTTLVEVEAWR